MKGYNLFLGAVTISAGSAGVSPHGSDPAIAYFSSYKQPGCHDVFKGPYITLTQTQDSVCYAFDPPPPIIVQSAYTASIISGCVGEFSTAVNPPIVSSTCVLTVLK